MFDFGVAKKTVEEMVADGESGLYIRIYINDLRRGGDITEEERRELTDIAFDLIEERK